MTAHADLRKACCEWLKDKRAWFYPVNSQGYGRKGIPDILSCLHGWFVAVECKVPPDTPNAWQKRELFGEFDERGQLSHMGVQPAGGVALVVTDVAQLEMWYQAWENRRAVN